MTQKNNSTQGDASEDRKQTIQTPLVLDVLGEKEMALLAEHLTYLKLPTMAENYEVAALKANKESWSYVNIWLS